MEHVHVRRAAEVAHEVEAAAAETAFVQLFEVAVRDVAVKVGDRAKGAVADRDGIERDAVVGAVHAGVDDHGAADAEL